MLANLENNSSTPVPSKAETSTETGMSLPEAQPDAIAADTSRPSGAEVAVWWEVLLFPLVTSLLKCAW